MKGIDWTNSKAHQSLKQKILQTLKDGRSFSKTVLDCCCGEGYWANYFPNYVGIDTDLESLQAFKGQRILADARFLPFQDNSFQLAISIEALEHIPEWQKTMSEIQRVSNEWLVTTPVKKFGSLTRLICREEHGTIQPSQLKPYGKVQYDWKVWLPFARTLGAFGCMILTGENQN